jgi:hypothetical protein
VLANESNSNWKNEVQDTLQGVGIIVVDKAIMSYDQAERKFHEVVNYFKNNTIGGVVNDAVHETKSVSKSIAEAAKKVWDGVGRLVS